MRDKPDVHALNGRRHYSQSWRVRVVEQPLLHFGLDRVQLEAAPIHYGFRVGDLLQLDVLPNQFGGKANYLTLVVLVVRNL